MMSRLSGAASSAADGPYDDELGETIPLTAVTAARETRYGSSVWPLWDLADERSCQSRADRLGHDEFDSTDFRS